MAEIAEASLEPDDGSSPGYDQGYSPVDGQASQGDYEGRDSRPGYEGSVKGSRHAADEDAYDYAQ